MRLVKALFTLFIILLLAVPVLGQVLIDSNPEDAMGWSRGDGVTLLHGMEAQGTYIYSSYRVDAGDAGRVAYSSDRGANWTNIVLIADIQIIWGDLATYNDTTYGWFNWQNDTQAPRFGKFYNGALVQEDTLPVANTYTPMYIRTIDKSTDSVMAIYKTSNHYLRSYYAEGQLLEGMTWTASTDSTQLVTNTSQLNWVFAPVSDGIFALNTYNGSATNIDTAYFFNTQSVYIVDLSLTDNYAERGTGVSMDNIQFCPADADNVDNDTLAFVMQNDTTSGVEFVIGWVNPASSYDWTEIRRVFVVGDGMVFSNTDPTTFRSPCLSRTPDGVWITYYGYWSDTTKGVAYKYSFDDGATWGDETILLSALEANDHMRYRTPWLTPAYASGDSILIGVTYITGWGASDALYYMGVTIGNLAEAGASTGSPAQIIYIGDY